MAGVKSFRRKAVDTVLILMKLIERKGMAEKKNKNIKEGEKMNFLPSRNREPEPVSDKQDNIQIVYMHSMYT